MHTFSGGGEGITQEAHIHSKHAVGWLMGVLTAVSTIALFGVISGERVGDALAQCIGLQ